MFASWIIIALVAAIFLAATAWFTTYRGTRFASLAINLSAGGLIVICVFSAFMADLSMDIKNGYEEPMFLATCLASASIIGLSIALLTNIWRSDG